MGTLLDEAVTDVAQRDAWRAAKGFCRWHACLATSLPHSGGSLAILYADVLHHDLTHFAALLRAAGTRAWWRPVRAWRTLLQRWLQSWRGQVCPACRAWSVQERVYLDTLLESWQEPELSQAFAQSHGFCWPHTVRVIEHGTTHAALPAFLSAHHSHLLALQHDVHTFLQKQDYRFARQPYGREADAWRRLVARYVGTHDGVTPGPLAGL